MIFNYYFEYHVLHYIRIILIVIETFYQKLKGDRARKSKEM